MVAGPADNKRDRRTRRSSWRDPSLRIGDAERNEMAEALSQHYSAGRLDDAELKERLDRAMSAKTGNDLAGLVTDLPPLDPAVPSPPAPVRAHRRGLGLVVAVAVLAGLVLTHAPTWWPWSIAVRLPWIVIAFVVALVVWRRSRRGHHSDAEAS